MAMIGELLNLAGNWIGTKVWYTKDYNGLKDSVFEVIDWDPIYAQWVVTDILGYRWRILENDPNFELYLDPPKLHSKRENACICDIHLLMRQGCGCGAIQREREAKDVKEEAEPITAGLSINGVLVATNGKGWRFNPFTP